MTTTHRDRNQEYEILGETKGAANYRLYKAILFDLVQKTNRDSCYRCGRAIKTPEDLSIDHKLPWRYRSKKRYWNLKNIAFSHKRCNVSHTPKSTHCSYGHPWTEKNTRRAKNECRECRACGRKRWHERKARINRNRRIWRLHDSGLSLRQIARRVKVSHVTVKNVIDGR